MFNYDINTVHVFVSYKIRTTLLLCLLLLICFGSDGFSLQSVTSAILVVLTLVIQIRPVSCKLILNSVILLWPLLPLW